MYNLVFEFEDLLKKKELQKENNNGKRFFDKENPEVRLISEKFYEKLVESDMRELHKKVLERLNFSVDMVNDEFGPVSGVVVKDNTYLQI